MTEDERLNVNFFGYSNEALSVNSIKKEWFNTIARRNYKSKELVVYDIDNSWFHALNKLGYPEIAKDIQNTPKYERLLKIKKYEEKIPKLLHKCEETWLEWVKKFIIINDIKMEDVIRVSFDAIVLKPSAVITNVEVEKGVKFDKQSRKKSKEDVDVFSTEEADKNTNYYDNHAHTEDVYNKIIEELKNAVKKLYSSKLLEKNLNRVKENKLSLFKHFPDKINLLNNYLKHLGVKERYTNEQFKSMLKQQLDKYVTITPMNEILKKIDECKKYNTSNIVGEPFGDESLMDLSSNVLEALSFDADGYQGKQLPFHFTFYNFKGSEEVLYKGWFLKQICKLDKAISFRQLKRLFTHKDMLMSGKFGDDFYDLANFDKYLVDYHVTSARDSEKEVLYKDLAIFQNMFRKFGELELWYHYVGTAFAFTHVKIDEKWLKVVKHNTGKKSNDDDDDESYENLAQSTEFLNTNNLLKGFTSTHETDNDMKKKVKIFKCPICKKKYTSAKFLENHVLQEHSDMIPREMPVAQYIFNLKNKKEHGNCVICKRPTTWNEKINKYHRFCSPKCKDIYVKEARARLMRVYGTDNLAKDPEHQKKMLENRKISKKYTFSDGGSINCVGSYEYDFIKYCDEVMSFGSKDIVDPSHNNILFRYEFENKERFYIPDFYLPDYNLLIEIKDKGDNNHENIKIHMKAMDNEKFRAVIESNKYNFITICGKDYSKFVELIEYLKSESLDDKADNKLIISIDQSVYKEYNLRSDKF